MMMKLANAKDYIIAILSLHGVRLRHLCLVPTKQTTSSRQDARAAEPLLVLIRGCVKMQDMKMQDTRRY